MKKVVEALNLGLHQLFTEDPRVFLMGEDLIDPYGGAFKVSKGISTRFPNRVLSTPISESTIIGLGAGMAMQGLRPIVEIMFGDFLTLGMDQLLNHIAKYRWMFNEQVTVPMVIRTPMGGGRGYGPTHSQSIEKHFMGIPGLRVIAVNRLTDPGELLKHAVAVDEPVLFLENKRLYPLKYQVLRSGDAMHDFSAKVIGERFPTVSLSPSNFLSSDVTIVTYGAMTDVVIEAAHQLLMEEEINCEIVVLTHIKPFLAEPMVEALSRSKRLLIVEEGTAQFGWGREVVYQMLQVVGRDFLAPPHVLGAKAFPIASSPPLEAQIIPGVEVIKQRVTQLVAAQYLEAPPVFELRGA